MEKDKRPVLTKEGELFLNFADRVFTDFHATKKAINLNKRPKIELGFTPNFPSDYISKAVKSIEANNTFVSVRRGPSSEKLVELTKKNELALSFVYNPVQEPDLIVEEIAQLKLMLVINQDHILAKETEITEEMISNETLISYYRNNTLWVKIDEMIKSLNLNLIEVYDIELLKKFLHDKIGFAFLPELTIPNYRKLNLCIRPIDLLDAISISLCAVYRKDAMQDDYLQDVIFSTINKVKKMVKI